MRKVKPIKRRQVSSSQSGSSVEHQELSSHLTLSGRSKTKDSNNDFTFYSYYSCEHSLAKYMCVIPRLSLIEDDDAEDSAQEEEAEAQDYQSDSDHGSSYALVKQKLFSNLMCGVLLTNMFPFNPILILIYSIILFDWYNRAAVALEPPEYNE